MSQNIHRATLVDGRQVVFVLDPAGRIVIHLMEGEYGKEIVSLPIPKPMTKKEKGWIDRAVAEEMRVEEAEIVSQLGEIEGM